MHGQCQTSNMHLQTGHALAKPTTQCSEPTHKSAHFTNIQISTLRQPTNQHTTPAQIVRHKLREKQKVRAKESHPDLRHTPGRMICGGADQMCIPGLSIWRNCHRPLLVGVVLVCLCAVARCPFHNDCLIRVHLDVGSICSTVVSRPVWYRLNGLDFGPFEYLFLSAI